MTDADRPKPAGACDEADGRVDDVAADVADACDVVPAQLSDESDRKRKGHRSVVLGWYISHLTDISCLR
jgi:hypothetical protein